MKVEITQASQDDAIHSGAHEEIWVRVLTNQPLSPGAWGDVQQRAGVQLDAGDDKSVAYLPCAFYAEIGEPDEDGMFDGYSFEQWFIFPVTAKVRR